MNRLGFACKIEAKSINIIIPSWRYDVSIKEDIIEEIVRIYGYDKLPENPLPPVSISRIIPRNQRRISDIKRLLASTGYTEVVTWSFMNSQKAKLFSEVKEELTLQNPISSDLDYMRPSILPNLLRIANNNINRSFYDLSLFEVGPVFENAGDEVITSASGIRTGANSLKNSHGNCRLFDVFDVKADVASILALAGLDINKCQIRNNAPNYYHPTRAASICLGKNILGYFGQVHPSILKQFEIDKLIKNLNLEKCRGTRVGNFEKKGVSGGEKRRISLALELLVDPPIIFLDEPTSGLDSFTALLVMGLLKKEAK